MNNSLHTLLTNAETVIAALRKLSELPVVQPFHLIETQLTLSLIQFFPNGHKLEDGWREIAKPLARVLGGDWEVDSDGSWRSRNVTFPGLQGVSVSLHYIEPGIKDPPQFVDLSEPEEDESAERDEPDYDAPTARQEQARNEEVYRTLK